MSALIQRPGLIQMPLKISVLNEFFQNQLIHLGYCGIKKTAPLSIAF